MAMQILSGLLGRPGRHAAQDSAPVLDGPLRPNQQLDLCRMLDRHLKAPDDVAIGPRGLPLVSDGPRVLEIGGHWYAPMRTTFAEVGGRAGALCRLPDGGLAIAVDGDRLAVRGGRHDGWAVDRIGDRRLRSVTALAALDGDRIVVAEGSAEQDLGHWRHDLLGRGSSGRVTLLDLRSGAAETLGASLAWPAGVAVAPDGTVIVAEAWRHRLLRLGGRGSGGAAPQPVLAELPAYPGRLAADGQGGWWLTCFAVRTQLVEFLLGEPRFLAEMMRTVPEAHWVGPALNTTDDPLEPLQMGGIRQMGIKKPWAPPRSYGLVVRLDGEFDPTGSLHSRTDGKRHGITGVAVTPDGKVCLVSRGHGKLLLHGDDRESEEGAA
ncbi:hypothetical protein ACFOGJ_09385 [Marinibaculum pumilum]|uniref:Strictosidine synthase n=1 Tax=Marinibaculum pumilum TaxID=1766165 RepID=A0ABV7KYQ9_9PROT